MLPPVDGPGVEVSRDGHGKVLLRVFDQPVEKVREFIESQARWSITTVEMDVPQLSSWKGNLPQDQMTAFPV